MISLKVGGVPEHYNLPWHMLMASGSMEAQGTSVSWQDFPGGTGAMVEALNQGHLDMAMLLTEGAVSGILKGGQYRIVSLYVTSPLVWGVHVPADSPYQTMEEARGLPYAISRYGSGSHMMAYWDARDRNWALDSLRFVEVKDLAGARRALNAGQATLFFWEKYTTKPLVDQGEFRRIAEYPTPYPCFVACASEAALRDKPEAVHAAIKGVLAQAKVLAGDADGAQIVAQRYGIKLEDAEAWLKTARWADSAGIDPDILKRVSRMLNEMGLVDKVNMPKQLINALYSH